MFHCQGSSALNQVILRFKHILLNVLHRLLPCSHIGSPKQTNTTNPVLCPMYFPNSSVADSSGTVCTFAISLSIGLSHCLKSLADKMTVVSADLLFPSPPLCANKAPPYPECASTVQPQASTGTNSLHSVTGNKRWWTLTHIHGHKRYAIDMQDSHKMSSKSF